LRRAHTDAQRSGEEHCLRAFTREFQLPDFLTSKFTTSDQKHVLKKIMFFKSFKTRTRTTVMLTTTSTSGARRERSRGGVAASFFVCFVGVLLLVWPTLSVSSTIPTIDKIDRVGGSTPNRRLDELDGENDIDSISSFSSSSPSSSSSSFEKHPTTKAVAKSNEYSSTDIGKIKPSLSKIKEEDADYFSTSLEFEAAGLGSKCNTELSIPGSGSDYVSIGSCASVTDFKPRKVEVQGAGPDNTMETNIHDFGGGTFVVAHQSSLSPFLYFMVEFHIKSENGQCFYKPLGAGVASIIPPMSSEAKADVVHSWNNRHILKYATTPSEEGFGINTLYYEVDCPPPLPSSPPPSPPSPPPPSLDSVNFNKKTGAFIDKEEFISYAMNRTKYSDAHIILPDKFWSIVDGDGDGELNHSEFTRVVWAMDTGIIFGRPFLVFPSIETQHLTRFRAVNEPTSSEQAPLFATVPVPKGTIPYSQASWQAWYNTMSA